MEGFDFARWRSWLEAKGRDLAGTVEFGSNDEYLPGFWLGLDSPAAIGTFRCWSNGLADFDVLDKRTNAAVVLKMMNEVSDANFESTFNTFMTEYEKVN